jgi:integrase
MHHKEDRMAKRGRIYRRTKKDPITGERVEVGPFQVQVWVNGKDHRKSTHSEKREVAEKLLTKLLAAKDAGTLTDATIKPLRFKDLQAAVELDYRVNNRRSTDRMQDAFQALASKFTGWKTSAITKQRLTEYVTDRLDAGRAPATVVYELRILRHAFRLTEIPCPTFPSIEVNNTRKHSFEPDEFHAVVNHLPVYLRPVMKAAYLMGWRTQSELLPLEWKHVNFQTGIITLPGEWTKNGEDREYPFAEFPDLKAIFQAQREAREELQRVRGIMIPWVFFRVEKDAVKPIKSYTTAWKNATERAGLPGRWVHDFRRCGARALRDAAVPESIAMSLLGHKTPSMFKRYQITNKADLRAGVEKLAAWNASQAKLRDNCGTVSAFPVPKKEQHG